MSILSRLFRVRNAMHVDGKMIGDVNCLLAQDSNNSALVTLAKGTKANADGLAGFSKGCILLDESTGAIYTNTGTTSASSFTLVSGESSTDEKVKYDADDTTAGYISEKIIAGTGISLEEGTGDDKNKLVISKTGDSFSLDNVLFIKPDEDAIEGIQYKTILDAITYAGTQSLSETNQFAIILPAGEITENIETKDYIHIVGQNGTVLSGEVDSKSTVHARYSGIYNCQITDLKGLADKYMNLYNCVISGFNASLAGNLFANNCHFIASGGSNIDLTGLDWLETYNCIFDNATTEKFVLGYSQISGGVANAKFIISGSAEINFIRGFGATVLDGGSLDTTSCMLGVTVEAGGDWFNNNTLYDNRTSGLTATTTQEAIDELASNSGGELLYADKTISSAELKSSTTQINIVGAPGIGYALIPLSVVIQFKDGTEIFESDGADLGINVAGHRYISLGITADLEMNIGVYKFLRNINGESNSIVQNEPIDFINIGAEVTGNASNDAELNLRVYYIKVPIS